MKRISGQSTDFIIDGELIHANTVTLDITDNSAAAQTGGIPDGYVDGDVAAEGEIEVSTRVLQQMTGLARRAGSWRGIEPADILFYAKAGNEEMKIEAFGCKFMLAGLLDNDSKGGEALAHKIKYVVTSPDFIRINGVPYLDAESTDGLLG
ncbi:MULTISPECIES: phage protein [Lelliottia]|uniref:phage protein n=1 Tax=Lelliottia TaxID=1330545 RepID=UPI00192B0A94|nr:MULTISPECIES: phage protein [Lelliottia]MBL5884854.1 DUF2597 family protein [Lelliottia aquatilis]MBL5901734.1 DUF2597 family protein [Lelliottia amnigena]